MENEEDVTLESSLEEEETETTETETPEPQKTGEKMVPYDRFKEVNDELIQLKKKPKNEFKSENTIDLIKLGKKLQNYSDDELDFVTDYAKSKKAEDILKALDNEFIQEGIKARRLKVEKEKGLKPDGTQTETDMPRSFSDKIKGASLAEKEEMLKKAGLYRDYTPRKDSSFIVK